MAAIKSSSYHSQGNGKAEAAVKVAKNILKKFRYEDPYLALLACRNNPQQSYTYSPAQDLMPRQFRDIIPIISSQMKPRQIPYDVVVDDIARRRVRSKLYYDRNVVTPLKGLSRGEKVFVKPNPSNKHKPWMFGEVIDKPAPRSCVVQKAQISRNHRQIRGAMVEPEPKNRSETAIHDDEVIDPFVSRKTTPEAISQPRMHMELPSSYSVQQSPRSEAQNVEKEGEERVHQRHSRRTQRMPDKFKDFIV